MNIRKITRTLLLSFCVVALFSIQAYALGQETGLSSECTYNYTGSGGTVNTSEYAYTIERDSSGGPSGSHEVQVGIPGGDGAPVANPMNGRKLKVVKAATKQECEELMRSDSTVDGCVVNFEDNGEGTYELEGNRSEVPSTNRTNYGKEVGIGDKLGVSAKDFPGITKEVYEQLGNCDDFKVTIKYTGFDLDAYNYAKDNWDAQGFDGETMANNAKLSGAYDKEEEYTAPGFLFGSKHYYDDFMRDEGYTKKGDAYYISGVDNEDDVKVTINKFRDRLLKEKVQVDEALTRANANYDGGSTYDFQIATTINPVYEDKERCYASLNWQVAAIINQFLAAEKYYPLDERLGKSMFQDNCFEYEKTGLPGHQEDKASKLYFQQNRIYGFYYDVDKAKSQRGKWDSQYYPRAVVNEIHLYKVEYAGHGNWQDTPIGVNHPTLDYSIENIDNPSSKYYGAETIMVLNPVSGYTAAQSIVSLPFNKNLKVPMVETTGTSADQKTRARIENTWSDKYTSAKGDALGTNVFRGYLYYDEYFDRSFLMKEYKALFFYYDDTHDYLNFVLDGEPMNDSCWQNYRNLTSVYSEPGEGGIWGGIFDTNDGKDTKKNPTVASIIGDVRSEVKDLIAKADKIGITSGTPFVRGAFYISATQATNGSTHYNNGEGWDFVVNHPRDLYYSKNNFNVPSDWAVEKDGVFLVTQNLNDKWLVDTVVLYPEVASFTKKTTVVQNFAYTICVGQFNCTCADIDVLCDCSKEEAGCAPEIVCDDAQDLANCDSGYDCTESHSAECDCFDGGNCEGNGWITKRIHEKFIFGRYLKKLCFLELAHV